MSVFLIKGLSALIFGLGFGSGQKAYHKYKGSLWDLKYSPCTVRPSPRYAFAVKDMEEFKRAEEEWIKYNELRKYYFHVMDEIERELGDSMFIPKAWIDNYEWKINLKKISKSRNQHLISCEEEYYKKLIERKSDLEVIPGMFLDKRFEDIYKEMLEAGINFEYRPGIDYYSGFEDRINKYYTINPSETRILLDKYTIDKVSMNYKRFYKPEYV